MPWIKQIPISDATGLLKDEFDKAFQCAGRVWHIVQIQSLNPYITRAADTLGVEPQDFIQPGGQ